VSDTRCLICGGPCGAFLGLRLAAGFDCPSCRRYEITPMAAMLLVAKSAERVLALQALTRGEAARGRTLLLTSAEIRGL